MTAQTKIVFLTNKRNRSGILTKFFTGCYAYHSGFLVPSGYFYDMYYMRRRVKWPYKPYHESSAIMFDSPVEIPEEYFVHKILEGVDHYSMMDYALFALRPLFHLFGKSTRNYNGLICSEQVNFDLIAHGWKSPWPIKAAPPSPCDLLKHFSKRSVEVF